MEGMNNNEGAMKFPDKEEELNFQIVELNSALIELLGVKDGIERRLSSVTVKLDSMTARGISDSPKSMLLSEEQKSLTNEGIDNRLQIEEIERQIKAKESQLNSLTERREN